ncbi:CU044_2847 family protein [Streptomyces sp. NPDC014006]|uniref:CU044_2847 family protein n=1 Tax=Streptomyces sp. NPDC014006 TaxID=3364870 RepID=UPI0036FF5A94
MDEGAAAVVPVEIDGHQVLLSVASGGRGPVTDPAEEREIGWRAARMDSLLDGLTAAARAMGERLRQTGATKATVEFGCDVSYESGQLLAVLGKASAKSAWKVTLEWTAPETQSPSGT